MNIALSRAFRLVEEQRTRMDAGTDTISPRSHNEGLPVQSQPRRLAQWQPEAQNQATEDSIIATNRATDRQDASSVPSNSHLSQTTSNTSSSTLQQVMEDRRKRLESDKAAKDAAEKEKRKAVGQSRRDPAAATQNALTSKQSLYAQEQRERKREARAERERIMRDIQNDKAARKEKEALRRAQVQTEAADASNADQFRNVKAPQHWGSHQECSLQVRLFDGHTIRGKFASQQTLNNAIRTWIGNQRTDGDTPFTLTQILTPLPNRTITITEEEQTLESLGFLPNATLVMVPIRGFTNAYRTDQGTVGQAVSAGYNAASACGLMLKGAVGTVLSFGRTTTGIPNTLGEGKSQGDSSGEKSWKTAAVQGKEFNTLKRQGEENSDDQQLYNGNQVCGDLLCLASVVM
ncbi:MAG: hypothetical protein Q9220_005131 [cf. Caloplaca sp. 1 TL-2023]